MRSGFDLRLLAEAGVEVSISLASRSWLVLSGARGAEQPIEMIATSPRPP